MGVAIETALTGETQADAVAILVTQPPGAGVDGRLAAVAGTGELRGTRGEALVLHVDGTRVVAAGVGKRDAVDDEALRTAGACAAQALDRRGRVRSAGSWTSRCPCRCRDQAAALVEGTILGGYSPGRWKTNGDGPPRTIERIVSVDASDGVREAAERAALLAERTNRARDLANMPPNELNPHDARRTRGRARGRARAPDRVRRSARREMEELGMGALAAVGRGSRGTSRALDRPPLRAAAGDGPDSCSGSSARRSRSTRAGSRSSRRRGMEDDEGRHGGRRGNAARDRRDRGARTARARRSPCSPRPRTCPAATRSARATSSRAANGKTIEIINTDAEGRLVLADALWYARREGATHVLDLATLTGAMELALGDLYAGCFANDDEWSDRVRAAGRAQRRPRVAVSAPPALPAVHRLGVRRHEERLRRCGRGAPRSPRSFCASSRAKGRGRTSTWPARASSTARAATPTASRAAPASACG